MCVYVLFMYILIYIQACVIYFYMHVFVYIHVIYMAIYVYIRVCILAFLRVYMWNLCAEINTSIYMCVYVYACV